MTDYTYLEYVDGSNVSVCQTLADTFWTKAFFIGGTLIFFVLPLAILVMLYSVIAINLMTHPAIIPLRRLENPTSAQRYRKKVVMMLGTVVTFFFVCLLPFRALIVWIVLAPHEEVMKLGNEGYYSLLYFCRIMFYLNSAINPILYNLMSSKFRNGFLKLCGIQKNCFKKHKKALLRTSTFNTSSLTAITTSSIHRPSLADLNHHSKDRKSSILFDTSYKRDLNKKNSCSKSLLLCGESASDLKSLRSKGFAAKTNSDKRKNNTDKGNIKINERKKTSRRKSLSDFFLYKENSTVLLNHSQSMDSIFNKIPHRGGRKAKFKNSTLWDYRKKENTDNGDIVTIIKNPYNKFKSGLIISENPKSIVLGQEDEKNFKIMSKKKKKSKKEEIQESFV